MTDRQARWNRRLDQLDTGGSSPEPLILNEAMISQWLKDHRIEYNSATETIRLVLVTSDYTGDIGSWSGRFTPEQTLAI